LEETESDNAPAYYCTFCGAYQTFYTLNLVSYSNKLEYLPLPFTSTQVAGKARSLILDWSIRKGLHSGKALVSPANANQAGSEWQ